MTAPWNGPDEVAHFAYAEHLARDRPRPAAHGATGSQSTAQNVALFELNLFPIRLQPGGKPTYSALDRVRRRSSTAAGLRRRKNGSGPNSAANYPPLYYAYEAVVYKLSPSRSELARLFVMRLATVLLFVVTVGLTWLIAAELLAATWARALATGLVALQPKLAFGGGIVNPDLMLVRGRHRRAAGGAADGPRGPDVRSVSDWPSRSAPGCSPIRVATSCRPSRSSRSRSRSWRFRPGLRRAIAGCAPRSSASPSSPSPSAMLWVARPHAGGGGSAAQPAVGGLSPASSCRTSGSSTCRSSAS